MTERLKLFITTLGVKQIEISKRLGISHSNITRYLKGSRIPITVALSLQAKFSLSHTWLLEGEGPMFLKNETLDNESASLLEDYHSLKSDAQVDIRKYLDLQKLKHHYETELKKDGQKENKAIAISYKEKELINLWRDSSQEDRERILVIIKSLINNSKLIGGANIQHMHPDYLELLENTAKSTSMHKS